MEPSLLIKAVVAHTALWHNNTHYPVGAEIDLPEAEFNALAYYLVRKNDESTSTEQSDAVDIAAQAKAIADEMDAAAQAETADAPAETADAQAETTDAPAETADAQAEAIDVPAEVKKGRSKKAQ